jgi:hypothetical protein
MGSVHIVQWIYTTTVSMSLCAIAGDSHTPITAAMSGLTGHPLGYLWNST